MIMITIKKNNDNDKKVNYTAGYIDNAGTEGYSFIPLNLATNIPHCSVCLQPRLMTRFYLKEGCSCNESAL